MGYNIALLRPKNRENIGSIVRSAGNFGVNTVFVVSGLIEEKYKGDIHKFDHQMDTQDGLSKVNLVYFKDIQGFLDGLPARTTLVLVETYPDAEPLPAFHHPDNAVYVFGRETTGISDAEKASIEAFVAENQKGIPAERLDGCKKTVHLKTVKIETPKSLNLGVCAAIVMYDRHAKAREYRYSSPSA